MSSPPVGSVRVKGAASPWGRSVRQCFPKPHVLGDGERTEPLSCLWLEPWAKPPPCLLQWWSPARPPVGHAALTSRAGRCTRGAWAPGSLPRWATSSARVSEWVLPREWWGWGRGLGPPQHSTSPLCLQVWAGTQTAGWSLSTLWCCRGGSRWTSARRPCSGGPGVARLAPAGPRGVGAEGAGQGAAHPLATCLTFSTRS